MGENGGVLTTPMYMQSLSFIFMLAFCARKRVYLRGNYKFISDAKRVIYARKGVYLLVT